MFLRFGIAVWLVVLVALSGTALERDALALRRGLTHQQYQQDLLQEEIKRRKLTVHKLTAPQRYLAPLEQGKLTLQTLERPSRTHPRVVPAAAPQTIAETDGIVRR